MSVATDAQAPADAGSGTDRDATVVVVGAGIVGACCAVALRRAGLRVWLVDPGPPGGPAAASFGNGGWISPASVVPMAMPGLWRRVPGLLADRAGPLTIRPSALPSLAPWLWRFVRAGATMPRVEATSDVLAALLADAPDRHAALAREAGVPWMIRRQGLLYAYADEAALAADAAAWALRARAGVRHERVALDAEAWARWPGTAGQRIGLLVPSGAHAVDPGGWVAALVAHAVRLGVRRIAGRVVGWVRGDGRLVGVRIAMAGSPDAPSDGETVIDCGHAVLAAGIDSGPLAAAAGVRVPLAAERGYHLVLPWPGDAGRRFASAPPVMPAAGRMAVTVMRDGLRVAGQVELARPGDSPDWRRVDVLWAHARRLLGDAAWDASGLADRRDDASPPAGVARWLGHRPSTADGRPVIGPLPGLQGVVCAFGHGHSGLAMAPVTAEAVMQAVTGGDAPDRVEPRLAAAVAACAPMRFGD